MRQHRVQFVSDLHKMDTKKKTLLGINYRFVKRVNCVILLNINYFGMKRMHTENK